MLYIKNYDKFNLDKSSRSQYVYYRRKFNALRVDFDYLLSELYNLLDVLQSLREDLLNNKELLQSILNDTKAEFAAVNVSADSAFDYIQTLLDNAESALNSLEEDINNSISEIENSCSQGNTCTDEIEDTGSEEIVVNEEGCDEGCGNCSFSYNDPNCDNSVNTGGTYDPECSQWTDEFGNTYTGPQPEDGCTYSYTVDADGNEWTMDASCQETNCSYSTQDGTVVGGPDDCTFNCSHDSGCAESPMPENCSYNCDDSGCVYGGGSGCDYTSNGNEVDDECGEEIIECTLYGEECFETECGEACGNCGQDCSEGDCSESCDDSCTEDDTGCGQDDCCVYGGGSQTEGDDDCGEDCGDCCVFG